jgi:DNA-directed RNA polymerase specialized sigma24 family protein
MTTEVGEFEAFVRLHEPRLRRALIACWGPDLGREATAEALSFAWSNWDRIRDTTNPVGYLYVVGRRRVRRRRLRIPVDRPIWSEPWIEPALSGALRSLTPHQRVAVVLHHGFGWTLDEVSEVLGVSVSTVRNHIARAMAKLRSVLEVK